MKVYLVLKFSSLETDLGSFGENRKVIEVFDSKEKAIEYVKNFKEIEDEYFVKKEELSEFIEEHRDTIDELNKKEPAYFEDCDDEEILGSVLNFHVIDVDCYDQERNTRYIRCSNYINKLYIDEKEVK